MSRASGTYGRRGRQDEASRGIRQTASTYGKAKWGTSSIKAGGSLNVESESERFVSHLLTIDPRVQAFAPQPFCVDLIEERLLLTKVDVKAANHRYHDRQGAKLYTPDFSVAWTNGMRHVLEVKLEGFEGDEAYWEKLERARPILEANGYPLRTVVMPANTAHPLRMNVRALKQATHQCHAYLTAPLVERVREHCEAGTITVRALCAELDLLPGLIPVFLVSGLLTAELACQTISGPLNLSLAYGDLSHLCLLEAVER